jgi:WD40 repeat protein
MAPTPAETSQTQPFKYWAFISYSHRDKQWGDWLHRSLETYQVPKRFVGEATRDGPRPKKLFPIFRDRDELPVSADLGTQINEALAQSRYLIVICSPNSAASQWVNQEIKFFKKLGREDRVLALIVAGEPNASDNKPGFAPDQECFPEALRYRLDSAGHPLPIRTEPIAGDARTGKDGKTTARLKLLAGLLDVNFDGLRQREHERRRRSLIAVTVAASVIALTMGALAALAFLQANEANQQRSLAEVQKREAQQQKELAQVRETEARHQLAEFYAERGRQELIAGDPSRAAPFLAAAYTANPQQHVVQTLLGLALRPMQSQLFALNGHTDGIQQVYYSDDGRLIVSSQTGNSVIVWDAKTGKRLRTIPCEDVVFESAICFSAGKLAVAGSGKVKVWDLGHSEQPLTVLQHGYATIHVIAMSKGAQTLAIGCDSGLAGSPYATVAVWDLATKHKINEFWAGENVRALDFSPDGKRLAAGSDNHHLYIWDCASGQTTLDADQGEAVSAICFDGVGDRVASLSQKSGPKIWSVDDGSCVAAFPKEDVQDWNCLAFNHKGDRVLAGNFDTVCLWDWAANQVQRLTGSSVVTDACFSPDDRYVIAGFNGEHVARIWSVADGQLAAVLQGHAAGVDVVAFSPDSQYAVTGSRDRQLIVWDWQKLKQPIAHAGLPNPVQHVRFSPGESTYMAASSFGVPSVFVWNASSPSGGRVLNHPAVNYSGAVNSTIDWCFSPDGNFVATCGPDRSARLWLLAFGKCVRQFAHENLVISVAFSSDGKTLATAGRDNFVKLWETASGAKQSEFSCPGVDYVCFSPKGDQLLAIRSDGGSGAVTVWKLASSQSIELKGHSGRILSAIFNPLDGDIFTASTDKTARCWDPQTGAERFKLGPHADSVQLLRVSPDGKLVATCGGSTGIFFWDAKTGARVSQWEDPERTKPKDLAFSPSGDLAAIAVLSAVYLIDPTTGLAIEKITSNAYDVMSLTFSNDGSTLLTGNRAHSVAETTLSCPVGTPETVASVLDRIGRWQLKGIGLVVRSNQDE